MNKGPSWLGDSPWKTVVATADFHLIAYVPDLVEARIAELALQPGFARSEAAFAYTACPQNS